MRKQLPWIGLAIRLLAAAIWLVAGIAKLADLDSFRVQLGAYDILPTSLVDPVAYALPFAEIVIGLYLATGLFVRQAAAVGTGLMVIFLAAQARPGRAASRSSAAASAVSRRRPSVQRASSATSLWRCRT